MNTLLIRQVESGDPPKFQVICPQDSRSSETAAILSPVGFPVEGRPDSSLMHELRWYLEGFLDYPFPPDTEHAERVQDALRKWGMEAFNRLFGDRRGGEIFNDATREGYESLHLQISSDDPHVLAWPWEALHDPQAGQLAQTCQIERRLNTVRKPDKLARRWPKDQVNILLVTARPYEDDVLYRSISRPLVELIDREDLPAQVTVLRPPTFANLGEHLSAFPNRYHIVHFDGHGSYGVNPATFGGPLNQGPEGQLIFEDDQGQPDPITADQLSVLLCQHHIPAIVLNACQSAMVDQGAKDPFASVAAALLKSGIRSVVAMAYSLYDSGAQEFLPAFYRDLFRTGDVPLAARGGRQRMFHQKQRVCARGRYPLDDWLVPVVYQQEPFDFSFAKKAKKVKAEGGPELPAEARDAENPYGFVGRDGAVLELERAMHRKPAGLLIQGLGGIGKTTLARGFLQWLHATDGLGKGCFWFTFQDIRSAEYVMNRMGEALIGPQFITAEMGQKLDALAEVFRDNRFLIVWDNFEVVRGIPGTPVAATLSSEDQALLKTFLAKLRGGETKVIITSRSDEDWLETTNRYEIALGGLQGEEQWDYCEVILRDLGLTIDRKDAGLVTLMDLLGGHPLAMRVILPRLEKLRASALIQTLQSNLSNLSPSGDPAQDKLFATLRFAEQSLPEDLRPLLGPLSLHERFVDANYLEIMANQVDESWTREKIDRFFVALAVAGLLHDRGQGIFEMHPALTGFLRATRPPGANGEPGARWIRAFVDFMGRLADELTPRRLDEQRGPFFLHGANFNVALGEAERLGMDVHFAALIQSLAAHAQNTRNFQEATRLFERLATAQKNCGEVLGEARAYHQLGMIAEEQRDFATAEQWYRKSLAITEKQGNEHGAASTYHQLGIIAQEQRDFATAEQWYRKSLAIEEKQGNEHGAASTYHQLGMIAEERRDFATAEQWYRKSLAIQEKQGDEHGAALSYHQLGMIAEERREFATAEQWYRKSLAIFEKQGNEHGAASTYHQLGIIAQMQRDFATAEQWYRKALAIEEKQGNEHGAASTYHQLGIIAQQRRDFATAEQWYRKALAIWVKYGDQHNEGITRSGLERLRKAAGSRSIPEPGKGNLLHLLNETFVGPILRKIRGLLR
jgi:tetratricopeptide (TPR) repeat protein